MRVETYNTSQNYQTPAHFLKDYTPAATSVWSAQSLEHANHYMLISNNHDMQQPQKKQMKSFLQLGFKFASLAQQPSCTSAAAAIASVGQELNQSTLCTISQNSQSIRISGLPQIVNLSSEFDATSNSSSEVKTLPSSKGN